MTHMYSKSRVRGQSLIKWLTNGGDQKASAASNL